MALPRVGDVVDYRMSDSDCATWRAEAEEDPRLTNSLRIPEDGDTLPGLVVSVTEDPAPVANLRVFLDGRYDIWAAGRVEGTEPGTWANRTAV